MEFRLLTREEAATVPGMIDPMPESFFAVGAVDEKGVVACIGMFFVLHADPLWIRPDHRHSGKTLLRLWQATSDVVAAAGLGEEIFASMTETNPGPPLDAVVEKIWHAAGGEELKARFCVLPIKGNGHG
jgi:hypothetical protein